MRFLMAIGPGVFFAMAISAQEAYITDQLKAGLHEDKSLESAIIKVVPTGTSLEIIKREEKLSFVRDGSGVSGWISNDYLSNTAPGSASAGELQARADTLESRLNDMREEKLALEEQLKSGNKAPTGTVRSLNQLKADHATLEQDFKAEKLKNGKLQIELTELRKRVGQDSDTDSLYQKISTLEEDNKTLEIQLAQTLEKYGDTEGAANISGGSLGGGFNPGMRNMMIYLLVTLVLGLFGGAYILDLINRRRHGGFRI